MNRHEAIKATKSGAIAAVISGTITLAVLIFSILNDSQGEFKVWNDPIVFFDVFLIYLCAFGMHKKSRLAAFVILIYFIISKIYIGIETNRFSGAITGLIFIYFYAKAIKGSIVYHRLELLENPNYKKVPRLVMVLVSFFAIVLLLVMGVGLLTTTSIMPDTEVQNGEEMHKSDIELLISNGLISEKETIQYFYSEGFSSILESGFILTNTKVKYYLTDDDGEIVLYSLFLNEITSVDLIEKGGLLASSIYKISTNDVDRWIQISLSTTDDKDISFVEAIKTHIK
ncbi:MAG: hypothetical protein OCD01_05250 [Fibrobacterales bacterium]